MRRSFLSETSRGGAAAPEDESEESEACASSCLAVRAPRQPHLVAGHSSAFVTTFHLVVHRLLQPARRSPRFPEGRQLQAEGEEGRGYRRGGRQGDRGGQGGRRRPAGGTSAVRLAGGRRARGH